MNSNNRVQFQTVIIMADEDDKIQHSSKKNHDDKNLWALVSRDIKPLEGRNDLRLNKNDSFDLSASCQVVVKTHPVAASFKKNSSNQKIHHTDRRTAQKLKKGQFPIEAYLDLHGMGREKACDTLGIFIRECFKQKYRCVLVITGKGARSPLDPETGVLKQKVPEWMCSDSMRPLILSYCSAKPKHGGSGALYVLLRRNK